MLIVNLSEYNLYYSHSNASADLLVQLSLSQVASTPEIFGTINGVSPKKLNSKMLLREIKLQTWGDAVYCFAVD